MQFKDLDLGAPIMRALENEGYSTPTPIQEQCIPIVLEGRDLIGCAQTGTGKTAAFALPILQYLADEPRAPEARSFRVLVLTPTRELAAQVADSFQTYGRHLKHRGAVITGGVAEGPQKTGLHRGLDWLVATPGRLLDLADQRALRFDKVEILVLDEADRMLDMGFIHDMRKVLKAVPAERQTLLFSATMSPEIRRLTQEFLTEPEHVSVTPISSTAERIEQSVHLVSKPEKAGALIRYIEENECNRSLVFSRTKHGADKICRILSKNNISAAAIHGNKAQNARTRALEGFKQGRVRVLVATDIAARGIDVDDVTHVINYDLPEVPETYVHRIGRTARAGASGIAVSFCSPEERAYLTGIERITKQSIPVADANGNIRVTRQDASRAGRSIRRVEQTPVQSQIATGTHIASPARGETRGQPSRTATRGESRSRHQTVAVGSFGQEAHGDKRPALEPRRREVPVLAMAGGDDSAEAHGSQSSGETFPTPKAAMGLNQEATQDTGSSSRLSHPPKGGRPRLRASYDEGDVEGYEGSDYAQAEASGETARIEASELSKQMASDEGKEPTRSMLFDGSETPSGFGRRPSAAAPRKRRR